MKRAGWSCALAILAGCAVAGAEEGKAVRIEVRANKPYKFAIPRTIFGSFLEPIGNSTYNGLWAEILLNPSMEENLWSVANSARLVEEVPTLRRASELGLPLPWEPLNAKQGNRYEPRWGDAANSWRSLELLGVPGQATGIKERVYLPIHRELRYFGSVYAKHLSGPATLNISLRVRNQPDQVLAEASVSAPETEWTKHRFALEVPKGKLEALAPADFVLQVSEDERVLVDQMSLMPADAIDGLDPDMVRMAKEMETPLVRFGGNFTSGYHWRDGVGPMDKRISTVNIAWGIPEYNTFGTDEFLRFCDLIGASPQIALNLGSGTAEEAAGWVRYVNQRLKKTGLLWELGNELWGEWNLGYPTLGELPKRTAAFSRAIRAVDPAAQLIATGQDPDVYRKWNAAQLENAPGTYNYLSTHFVVTTTQVQQPGPAAFSTSASLALPVQLGRQLREMQEQINSRPGYKNEVHLAFTEWLFHPGERERKDAVSYSNMGGAIAAGGMFNMLLQHADIVPVSDITGIVEFAGIWKKRGRVYATPSYYAFRMYSTAAADRLVEVKTNSRSYDVEQGITRLPDIEHVPYLDVVAATSKSGDKLTLFCVNRNLTEDTPATVDLRDFAAGGTGHVQTLSAPDVYDGNDETKPDAIKPVQSEIAIEGEQFQYTFRHESVTRIELQRR